MKKINFSLLQYNTQHLTFEIKLLPTTFNIFQLDLNKPIFVHLMHVHPLMVFDCLDFCFWPLIIEI